MPFWPLSSRWADATLALMGSQFQLPVAVIGAAVGP
jgi:hypothetical protein